MTDNKRIKDCKRIVIAAINEARLPFAVTELILEKFPFSLSGIAPRRPIGCCEGECNPEAMRYLSSEDEQSGDSQCRDASLPFASLKDLIDKVK